MKHTNAVIVLGLLLVCLLSNVNASVSVSSCQNLTNPNTRYELTTSLSNGGVCLEVKASNIIIDCNDYMLSGDNTTDSRGIHQGTGYSNITILDCQFDDEYKPIDINAATRYTLRPFVLIQGNTFYHGSYLSIGAYSPGAPYCSVSYTDYKNCPVSLIGNNFIYLTNLVITSTSSYNRYNLSSNFFSNYISNFGVNYADSTDNFFEFDKARISASISNDWNDSDSGNFWMNDSFSETCSSADGEICDDAYNMYGTQYDYYPLVYGATGGGSSTGVTCNTSDQCADGFWCHDHSCVPNSMECFSASDCPNPTSNYCDNLTMGENTSACWLEKAVGGECYYDSWCSSGICTGEISTATACTSVLQCYGLGAGYDCMADGYCHRAGTCVLSEQACTSDTNCYWDATKYACVNGTTASGNTTCFCNELTGICDQKKTSYTLSGGGQCLRDAWCMDDAYSGLGFDMSCVGEDISANESGLCTPDTWECNYGGYGCASGEFCNWTAGVGDHTCYNCSMGACSSDSQCCSDNCMDGWCYPADANCDTNNGDYGVVSGTHSCSADNWCHSYYTLQTWYPEDPNYKCYPFLDIGAQLINCDYGYQCRSGRCSGGKCQAYNASSGDTTLDVRPFGAMTGGQWVDINAWYNYKNSLITGATCTFSSNGLVEGSGSLVGSQYAYSAFAQVANVSGTKTLTVTCSKTGYPSLSKSIYFTVYTTQTTSTLEWLSMPTKMVVKERAMISVRYKTVEGVGITSASCYLVIGGTNASMDEEALNEGVYYSSYYASTAQTTTYYVSCSKSTYQPKTSATISLTISSTPLPTIPIATCFNSVKDGDETDIDCGGSCSECAINRMCEVNADCISGWCYDEVCGSPSCSDHVKNGLETGIDCGGPCPECMCVRDSDCAADGTQHCVNYECTVKSCTSSSDCPDLLWYSSSLGWYSRDRECYNGVCRFSSLNESSGGLSIEISQKVPLTWNDSNRQVYIFICEDGTNTLTVRTSIGTRKWYHHSNPTYYTPYVPATSQAVAINEGYTLSDSVVLSKLCEIPTNSNNVSSLISFYATDTSQYQRVRSIYALSFRYAFKVNQTRLSNNQVRLGITRPAKCFYRTWLSSSNWTAINAVAASSVTWNVNLSGTSSYEVMCNNTIGEKATIHTSSGYRGLLGLIWDAFVVAIFAALWELVIGSAFRWQSWYILIIVTILLIVLPTLLFVILSVRGRNKQSQGGGQWED